MLVFDWLKYPHSTNKLNKQTMADKKTGLSKEIVLVSVAFGLVGVGVYALFRPSRRILKVEAIIPRDHKQVFQFHLDPVKFYSVLKYTKDNLNKHYKVLNMQRTGDKIDYTLSHVVNTPIVGSKDIRSNPKRFNIEIDENLYMFDETFTVLKTTFLLQYKFSKLSNKTENQNDNEKICKVDMNIELTGPYLLVNFFTRVKSDFENRFRITNDNIDILLP